MNANCLKECLKPVCSLVGIHREPRHANKHTDLCVPCWHTHGAWACNKHTFVFLVGIHRELGHANKHTFVLVGMPRHPLYANMAHIGLLATCVLLNASLSVSQ